MIAKRMKYNPHDTLFPHPARRGQLEMLPQPFLYPALPASSPTIVSLKKKKKKTFLNSQSRGDTEPDAALGVLSWPIQHRNLAGREI